ncbi:MAG: PEGA domain-containing protein [Bacteroidota bacterium]
MHTINNQNYRLCFLLLFLVLLSSKGISQNISVKSFRTLPGDMDARVNHPVKDQNGEKCALIKVVTDQDGFVWEGGMLGITKVEKKTGEYWVYIPHGSKKITIKHDDLGVLRDYIFPEAIKEATVYEMVLTTAKVETVVKPARIRSAYVIINSNPDSADVYIDDQYQGQTPFRRKLESGKHTFRLEKNLYHTKAGSFNVSAEDGREKMNIDLEPNFGSLRVSSQPEEGMRIFLDGENTGKETPAELTKIKTGEHKVTLKDKWHQPKSKNVSVKDNKTTETEIEPEPIYGKVEVKTDPPANIFIDDQKVGYGTYNGRLKEGIHSFTARKEKYDKATTERRIATGDKATINLKPEPKYGKLDVTSEPYDARILLNGEDYGKTPRVIHDLLVGEYEVVVKKDGYFRKEKTLTVEENETTQADFTLSDKIEVEITSHPKTARLFVNDEFEGKTPVTVSMSKGNAKIELKKNGYRDKSDRINVKSEKNDHSYELTQKKIYSGYNMEVEWGPDWGFEMGFFGNRFFLSGAIGKPKNFEFDEEIDVEDIEVNDIENYDIAGRKSHPDREGDEDQNDNIYLTAKLGYQLTWPFPFFVHTGYGVRFTPYYQKVYQAKHDYYPTNSFSTELNKGDHFTTPSYYVDTYNSFVFGIDIPVFDSMVIGADYWLNTEIGPTYNFSLGFMFRDIKN